MKSFHSHNLIVATALCCVALLGASCATINDNEDGKAASSSKKTNTTVVDTTVETRNEPAPEPTTTEETVADTTEQPVTEPTTTTTPATTEETAPAPPIDTTTTSAPTTEPTPAPTPTPTPTPEPTTTPEEPETTIVTIELQVVSPAGAVTYSVEVNEGATVEQVMKNARAKGLSFSTKNFGGLGAYVQAINGLAEDESNRMVWIYYMNGKPATRGIDSQTVKKADVIKWNYEKQH